MEKGINILCSTKMIFQTMIHFKKLYLTMLMFSVSIAKFFKFVVPLHKWLTVDKL